jgi:hypothetical protein
MNHSMWQDEIEATKPSSGSTPGSEGAVGGMFAGLARPAIDTPLSKRHSCMRL